jgi:hypothetical protein
VSVTNPYRNGGVTTCVATADCGAGVSGVATPTAPQMSRHPAGAVTAINGDGTAATSPRCGAATSGHQPSEMVCGSNGTHPLDSPPSNQDVSKSKNRSLVVTKDACTTIPPWCHWWERGERCNQSLSTTREIPPRCYRGSTGGHPTNPHSESNGGHPCQSRSTEHW